VDKSNTSLDSERRTYRSDITGLRAIAVSFVLLSHYFPEVFVAGFLGVDLFFVISGFVITRALLSTSHSSLFEELAIFYANRIRRIAPALFVIVILVLVISPLFMTKPGGELAKTGAYSLIGFSNLYLYHVQADYFGLKASQNPFTHTWSLGVEEQFYIFFPLIFFTLRKIFGFTYLRIFSACIFILILLSLAVNIIFSDDTPSAVFYSMPARIWEIAAGAFTMILLRKESSRRKISRINYWGLLTITLGTMCFSLNTTWLSQIILVIAVSLLLYFNEYGEHRSLLNSRPLVWLGNCSFSVYLIHWPLLVGSSYVLGSNWINNLFFAVLSILLGWVLYIYIEIPFRSGKFRTNTKKTLAVGLTILALTCFGVLKFSSHYAQSYSDFFPRLLKIESVPAWKNYRCSGWENIRQLKDPITNCLDRSSADPRKVIYLVGDSHSVQFIPMVQQSSLSKSYLLKYLNLEKKIDFPFAEFKPNSFSASIMEIIKTAKSGDYVVLAFHRGHLNPERDVHLDMKSPVPVTSEAENLIKNLSTIARILQKRDVKIVLISDTPLLNSDQNVQSCAMQMKLFGQSACKIDKNQDLHTRSLQDYVFKSVDRRNENVVRWDPLPLIYRGDLSFDVLDAHGQYLMLDSNHISSFTALLLVPYFNRLIQNF
jgi:peptidoglycan/LPS O-acetylase OafA/YrhL